MPAQIGFDNERYLEQPSAAILERVQGFDSKLYLEFGGKLGVHATSEPEFATKYLFVG